MNILSIAGVGIIAAIICVILRPIRPEFALLVSLGAGLFIISSLLFSSSEVIGTVSSFVSKANLSSGYTSILLKSLGICFVTQIACDTCKDAGESAISAKIEMAGKIAVLIISLPLFEQTLNIVYSLINI